METLKEIHNRIVHDGGVIRHNFVGVRHPRTGAIVANLISPDGIETKLNVLITSLNEPDAVPPLISAINAKLQMVKIHPFRDGNGRLARLIFNWVLRKRGLAGWTSFPGDEMDKYYDAIGAAPNELPFFNYALFCVDRSYTHLLNDL